MGARLAAMPQKAGRNLRPPRASASTLSPPLRVTDFTFLYPCSSGLVTLDLDLAAMHAGLRGIVTGLHFQE